jgi:hypothetical protein
MAEFIDLIVIGLLVVVVGSSLLFGAMVFTFTDKSKLSAVERNTWFYWNKDVLFKSAQPEKRSLLWVLARLQKYSLFWGIVFAIVVTLVKYASNT